MASRRLKGPNQLLTIIVLLLLSTTSYSWSPSPSSFLVSSSSHAHGSFRLGISQRAYGSITARIQQPSHFALHSESSSSDTMESSSSSSCSSSSSPSRTIIDKSTLILLEHININIPSHEYIDFYFKLLNLGMDPRKAENLGKDNNKTLWANCGASQFHLPHGDTPQVVNGHMGLVFDRLDLLEQRLDKYAHLIRTVDKQTSIDPTSSQQTPPCIHIEDLYGNRFSCRANTPNLVNATLQQPFIRPADTDQWKNVAVEYGKDAIECQGLQYVEFKCPVGTAAKIALFYESVLDVTTTVLPANNNDDDGDDDDDDDKKSIAIIAIGNIDDTGHSDQALIFRETTEPLPLYDGHHIAVYVGESAADFEQAFKNCQLANVVWVNPRFSDKADTLQTARHYKQFRFKNIVDMKTGETIFELEHEMRSIEHEAWPGKKIE